MKITRLLLGVFLLGIISGIAVELRVVLVAPTEILRGIDRCEHISDISYIACVRNVFRIYLRPTNIERVMNALQGDGYVQSARDDRSNPKCHEIAHIAGEVVSTYSSAPSSSLIAACGRSCGYGCAHGVVVGQVRKDPSVLANINALCLFDANHPLSKSGSIACFHGVGHAMTEYAGYDIQKAVNTCNGFIDTDGRQECWTGVFMEMYESPTASHIAPKLPDDSNVFCQMLGTDIFTFCIKQIAAAHYKQGDDIVQALGFCNVLAVKDRDTCAIVLGSAVYFAIEADIPHAVATCEKTGGFMKECIHGLILSSFVIDATGSQANEICQRSSVQNDCLSYVTQEKAHMNEPAL